jgi:aldehyde:ferredoxin oxidoreductase
MPFGYSGNILHVDLNSAELSIEKPDEAWYRTYMGGSGIASYHLFKLMKSGTEALEPGNILVFALSVVTGAPISGFNRFLVAAKSPITGYYAESEAGGYFGPELKSAGFDAIVIQGKSSSPVYLFVEDGFAEIKDASHLWGLDNLQTLEKLKTDIGQRKIRVASIGPAGERLVRFANITDGLEHFCGRLGLGAVMGSKNLKAVVAHGNTMPKFFDFQKVLQVARWMNSRNKNNSSSVEITEGGTPRLVKLLNASGVMPTRNFKYGSFNEWEKLSWEAMKAEIFHSTGTCYMCTLRCKRRVESDDSKYPLKKNLGSPEYETLASLGSNLLNSNLKSVARSNQLCSLYGMDTISVGNMIALVMECYEAGIINKDDLGGYEAKWGDSDFICKMVEDIGERRNFGNILAEGMVGALKYLGSKAEKYAFHIKGSDLPMHDGRGKTAYALGVALSPAGADHQETAHDSSFKGDGYKSLEAVGLLEPVEPLKTNAEKARIFHLTQRVTGINNLLGLCNFCSVPKYALTFDKLLEALKAITGWNSSLYELLLASERALVLARLFNIREGQKPEEDCIVSRWHEPFEKGPLKGAQIDPKEFRDAVKIYYQLCNWDNQGRPRYGKLLELKLDWVEKYL